MNRRTFIKVGVATLAAPSVIAQPLLAPDPVKRVLNSDDFERMARESSRIEGHIFELTRRSQVKDLSLHRCVFRMMSRDAGIIHHGSGFTISYCKYEYCGPLPRYPDLYA